MIYCHFECETYFYQYFLLLGKKLFKKEEDIVNINFNLLVSAGDDFFNDELNNEFDKMEKNYQFHNKLEDGFKN